MVVVDVVVVTALEVVESSLKKVDESVIIIEDYFSVSSPALLPPVMETFLLSRPDISLNRMSASVFRRKMTGRRSVRSDRSPDILLTLVENIPDD